jgi:RHS repeat-associated protein
MIARTLLLVRALAGSWRRTFARGVSSRPVVALTLIGLVASLGFSAVLVPLAAPAQAAPPAGTGGMFTAMHARIADTRTGVGGHTGAMPANTDWVYQVTGTPGVPSTGVSAVALTVTVLAPAAAGDMSVTSNPKAPGSTGCVALTWGGGQTVSNATVVAVTSNGQIVVNSSVATGLTIDVQGYFLTGNGTPTPGGYVPVTPTRIVDTRNGTGAPLAKIGNGATLTLQATGVAGVPAGASAVFVNITVVNQPGNGWIMPYATGTSGQGTLSFPGTLTTNFGVSEDLSTAGKMSIYVGAGGPIDVLVDVVGYYAATNGLTGAAGSFNPIQQRVLDTRTGTALGANSVTTIPVAGVDGIPAPGSGLASIALNVTAMDTTSGTSGYLRAWAANQAEPTTVASLNYTYGAYQSNLVFVAVAPDGTIKIRNGGAAPINVAIDVEGWYASSTALPQAAGAQCTQSGSRAGSQPVTHQLSDSTTMSTNPTNGNLALGGSLLHLRGVGQDLNIGWRYNGINDTRPTLNTGLYENALQPWTDGSFTYVSPDGGCYHFTPKTGSTWPVGPDTNQPPAGINATMYSPVAGTMKLRFNPSGVVNTYVKTGGVYELTSSADKNVPPTSANLISYTYTGGKLVSIKDTQGRVVTFAYSDPNNATQPSSIIDTSLSRTISLAYGGTAGALSQITDATGAVTTLGYDNTGLTSLTNNGNQTSFGYDPTSRLTNWTFGVGSPATSNWTAAYTSSTVTKITDGNGNTATYDTTAWPNTTITDPLHNIITSNWDGHDNLHQSTDAMGNLTTNTYVTGSGLTANNNNLLSQVISPAGTTGGTGAKSVQTFPSVATGALADFQPSGTVDAQGNTSTIFYDPKTRQPNQVTYANAAGAGIGGTKSATYQGDSAGTNCGALNGQMCTATNGNGNLTSYGYTNGNPTSITPPAPLGGRAFTYDAAGRVLTATDGRGNTTYYAYDGNDRITQVSHTAGSCPAATCVDYTYDGAGNLTSRTSPTGATSYTYDALNRPITKTQAGVLAATATYDPASNLTSYTDPNGTIGYGYDSANRLVSLAEPGGSCPLAATIPNSTACTVFGYDADNRRTTTGNPNGVKSTTVYDGAGRVTSVTVQNTALATIASRVYVYQSAPVTLADQSLVATMTDQSGTTTYKYDGLNRLTSSTTAAGIISSWAYDNDGNRTSTTKTGAATAYSAYNSADQLCWTSTTSTGVCASPPSGATTYSYDASGNQSGDQIGATTLANSFNVFNQLTSTLIGGTTTQANTYAGTSNTERLSAGATSFLNGTLGVTSETTSGASINYIRDPSGNLIAMHTGGQSYYYTTDAQGSVIALTDSTQALAATYTYDPWGNTTSSTGALATTNPWHYAGSYTDTATGYLKLGARYYNPTTGRFTQPDPASLYGGYAYAGDNPVNNVDPMGQSWWNPLQWGIWSNAGVRGCVADGAGGGGIIITYGWFFGPMDWGLAGITAGGSCVVGVVNAYWH